MNGRTPVQCADPAGNAEMYVELPYNALIQLEIPNCTGKIPYIQPACYVTQETTP
ncbi:hypothetical protein [Paenibacillus sp. FSL H3-0286]|uniref:hypothetical protein n=1 Tax=Paenibacillus sp. FSL H3-0286 TaxID=2921427 RepID=UPI00324987DF